MSAIAKPFITPLLATSTPATAVDIEMVQAIDKCDISAGPFNQPADYQIIFTYRPLDSQANSIIWHYALLATRDTEYTNVVAAMATAV